MVREPHSFGDVLEIIFQASISKDAAYPNSNEDVLRFSEDVESLALCDGATESFDSRTWANIVAASFLRTREFSMASLDEAIREYRESFQSAQLSWAQQAAFERGSFSTLLGVCYSKELKSLRVSAVGDTLCALIEGEDVLSTFPYTNPADFDNRPRLLSTIAEQNDGLFDDAGLVGQRASWLLDADLSRQLLCMSDALGRWFLECNARGDVDSVRALLSCDEESFSAFVIEQRQEHALKADDTTLVVIGGF